MKNAPLLFIIFILSGPIIGQNNLLPPGEVFRDDVVPKIFLTIHPDSLDALLDLDNYDKEHLFPGVFRFTNGFIDETIENVGLRLRGNTSLVSAKKSLKISFNSFGEKRKWRGLEKMNINGEHNDPSISRSKIVWDIARKLGLPASRSNHVELYINGDYVGLYVHVEHIDEEYTQSRFNNNQGNLYKCFYGSDLRFRGNDPDEYKHEPFGRRVYELKNNKKADDYSDLAHFIDVLNNSSITALPCELEAVFNVQDWLKYLALHILSGHWDDPILNKNNFYLYHNLATGKFEYILYDVDNTLGVDFLNNNLADRPITNWGNAAVNNPLYHRVLQVPEYRDQLYQILDQAVEDFYNQNFYLPYIFELRDKISSSVENDPVHGLDYGFTFEEWEDSFLEELDYGHVEYSIHEFIDMRSNSILEQLPAYEAALIFNFPKIDVSNGFEDFPVSIKVTGKEIETVEFCFIEANGTGDINCFELFDDGDGTDQMEGDQIYSGIASIYLDGEFVSYFTAEDALGEEFIYSCGFGRIYVNVNPRKITINELVAKNDNGITDESGEFEDWIELYNLDEDDHYLGELFLSDNFDIPAKYKIPDQLLEGNGYQLIWADNDVEQGIWHTNFKLSSSGERLFLFQEVGGNFGMIEAVEFDSIAVDSAFARIPNGTGPFQITTPTPSAINGNPNSTTSITNQTALSIFPNPVFNNIINISAPENEMDNGEVTLIIYHSDGKILFTEKRAFFPNNIKFGHSGGDYPPGIYFLEIIGSTTIYQGKIIKL